jgi:hypothetical protein
MAKSSNVWNRVGVDSAARLRWLLNFGNLEPSSLTDAQRASVLQEARAFMALQEVEPARRAQMSAWPPPPTGAAPRFFSEAETWSVQRWLKRGLGLLSRSEKWQFAPRVKYELDAYKGLLWARLRANSLREQFKAAAYDALREARFSFRLCPECSRPFVPSGRQAYCSARCSQAVRTRKWRRAHPERNRAIRRAQYRRSVTARLKLVRQAVSAAQPVEHHGRRH